jgi:hypothetical protein
MKEPQSLCQEQRNLHVHEIMALSCVRNERRKEKKNVLWSCERERRNKIGKRVGKWILIIKIGEYFHSPKLFG